MCLNWPWGGCKFADNFRSYFPSNKGDFLTAIIGISRAITNVLCITINALLTRREVKMAGYWFLQQLILKINK